MISDLLLIGAMALLALYAMKTMAILAARGQFEYSRQQTARARIKGGVALGGMAFLLTQRFSTISAWDLVMIGVMLVVVVRRMQASDDGLRDACLHPLKHRLAAGIGVLVFLVVFFNVSVSMRLMLSSLVAMACLGGWKPTHVSEPVSEIPAEPSMANEPGDETSEETPRESKHRIDPDQATLSYAHPLTGMFHVDAALSVYVSSEDGPSKARARRIIVVHLTRVPAFLTGDPDLDDALKHVVTGDDSLVLTTQLQAIADHLNEPTTRQSEAFEETRNKVLTVLGIAKLIARNPEEGSLLEQGEDTVNHLD